MDSLIKTLKHVLKENTFFTFMNKDILLKYPRTGKRIEIKNLHGNDFCLEVKS
jgi:hypothetical protein